MDPDHTIGWLLLALAIVIAVGQLLAILLRRWHQPAALAQIVAGILLGPAILGAVWAGATDTLFPPDVRSALAAIGTVGLALFMFLVGTQFDVPLIRREDRTLGFVSAGAVCLPFALGIGVAALLLSTHDLGGEVDTLPFVLFVATALSITAFPVLAAIVEDIGMRPLRVAQLAIGSAAVQDAAGWILLTAALTAASAGSGGSHLLRVLAELVAFLAVIVLVVRPLAARFVADSDGLVRPAAVPVIASGLLASAATTELMGLHAVLGAFAFGVVIPRGTHGELIPRIDAVFRPLTVAVLLPVTFVLPGLTFSLSGLSFQRVAEVLLIIACACVGKIAGGSIPALIRGAPRREALILGVLLNTRGLVELVVLQVGYDAGIIDRQIFSELLVMALVTTFATVPLVRRLGVVPGEARIAGIDAPTVPELSPPAGARDPVSAGSPRGSSGR